MVEAGGIFALIGRHRLDDRLGARQRRLIDLRVFERARIHAGHHARQVLQIAHALELDELIVKIGEGEFVGAELLFQLLRLFLIERRLRLFDEREHIAHAEDARRHASRVERLDLVELFAHADELDGLARNGFHRERRAAARVAVELGQEHAVNIQRVVERLRGVHCVLTRHGVHHEQDLVRLHRRLDRLELVHERFVDVQAARRVKEHHVVSVPHGVLHGGLGDVHRVVLTHLKHRDAELPAHDLKLLDGSGAVHVARGEQRVFALLFKEPRELRAVRRFARAL